MQKIINVTAGLQYVLACVAMPVFIIIINHQNTQIYSAVHTYTHGNPVKNKEIKKYSIF